MQTGARPVRVFRVLQKFHGTKFALATGRCDESLLQLRISDDPASTLMVRTSTSLGKHVPEQIPGCDESLHIQSMPKILMKWDSRSVVSPLGRFLTFQNGFRAFPSTPFSQKLVNVRTSCSSCELLSLTLPLLPYSFPSFTHAIVWFVYYP